MDPKYYGSYHNDTHEKDLQFIETAIVGYSGPFGRLVFDRARARAPHFLSLSFVGAGVWVCQGLHVRNAQNPFTWEHVVLV